MNILWVFAHPERRSLNGSLMDEGVRELHRLGHNTQVSDLYAMKWDPVVDAEDFDTPDPTEPGRLLVGTEQERAHHDGRLSADIRAEQEKIR